MKHSRKVSRRSFIGQVAGASAATGALGLVGGPAWAQQQPVYTGVTDSNAGSNADRPGYGRRFGATEPPAALPSQTGLTDGDTTDPAGDGGNKPMHKFESGPTDCDSGAGADPGGGASGRTPRGVTDQDRGLGSDPRGCGRGVRPAPSTAGDLPEAQRLERCQNNRARLAELERQALAPEGWSDEQLARARAQLQALEQASATAQRYFEREDVGRASEIIEDERQRVRKIYREYGLRPGDPALPVTLRRNIARAERASVAARNELHLQIAFHRNNLVALGCDR